MIDIKESIILAPLTTFKIGGVAKFFAEVKNEEEIMEAVKYAKDNNLEIFVLGGGSNVLISDKGFDGLVIKIKNSQIIFNDTEIVCEAGVPLAKLINSSIENSLSGLEWAVGIPGTVGGAVRGNAGAYGKEISANVAEIKVLDIGKDMPEIKVYSPRECKFDYRSSIVKENKNLIVISVKLKLNKGDRDKSREDVAGIIKKRIDSQPKGFSVGSFFKNPVVDNKEIIEKFEHDTEVKMRGDKLPAGWFIQDLGFKGKKIGGAQVSEKHANFLINTGDASAEDVIILSSFLKQKVRDSYGVQLEEEVSKIGF